MAISLNAPQQMPPASRSQASVEQKFHDLTSQWRRETALHSSVTAIAMHPAYQQIIGMGTPALPLILQELQREPDHWFWALGAITGENPIPEKDAGDMEAMTDAWLSWGSGRCLSRKSRLSSQTPCWRTGPRCAFCKKQALPRAAQAKKR